MLLHGIDLRLRQPSGGRRGGGRSRNPTDPTYFPSSPSSPPLSLFLYLSLSLSLSSSLPLSLQPSGGRRGAGRSGGTRGPGSPSASSAPSSPPASLRECQCNSGGVGCGGGGGGWTTRGGDTSSPPPLTSPSRHESLSISPFSSLSLKASVYPLTFINPCSLSLSRSRLNPLALFHSFSVYLYIKVSQRLSLCLRVVSFRSFTNLI